MTLKNSKLTTTLPLILISILITSNAQAEIQANLDLAGIVDSAHITAHENEDIVITIKNLAPGKIDKYSFGYTERYNAPPPFTRTVSSGLPSAPAPFVRAAVCNPLKSKTDSFILIVDEKDVESAKKALEGEIAALSGAALTTCVQDVQYAKRLIGKTSVKAEPIKLAPDTTITFYVYDNSSGEPVVIKKLEVSPLEAEKSKWITTYGFSFVDSIGEKYHSKKVTNDDGSFYYNIAKQSDHNSYDYAAQVLFTYPFWQKNGFATGVTGGLGASQDSVSAVAGLSLVVHTNLVFTVGYNFQEHSVLKGQYTDGENIGSEPLDSDVLEEKVFKGSPSFIISFKFE